MRVLDACDSASLIVEGVLNGGGLVVRTQLGELLRLMFLN